MNPPVTGEADRETVLEVQELLPLAASQVMHLGAALLAVTHLAPEVAFARTPGAFQSYSVNLVLRTLLTRLIRFLDRASGL